jgi:hypothetical protein
MAVNRLNVGATNQLLAKASSGQSTNILELQNTAGVTVAGVDASGNGVGGLAHPPTFKNLIINGAMQVHQRSTSVTGVTASSYNTADRWRTSIGTQGTWTQSVENDGPTGSGFAKSLKMLCTTADASPAADDFLVFDQLIEGQNLQQIAKGTSSAKQLTLSFWVKSNVTGNYIAFLQDIDNTRSVSALYTVSASATWEKKTITFPADTTGAFDNDNVASLMLRFVLGAGTNWTSGTRNETWASLTLANLAPGQTVNLAAATDNYWQVTGVQLEVGSTATDYEFKPYDIELRQCLRYFWRQASGNSIAFAVGTYYSTTEILTVIQFPVVMRAAPTLTTASGTDYYSIVRANGTDGFNNLTSDQTSNTSSQVYNNAQVSGTAGHAGIIRTANAAARVDWSIEL